LAVRRRELPVASRFSTAPSAAPGVSVAARIDATCRRPLQSVHSTSIRRSVVRGTQPERHAKSNGEWVMYTSIDSVSSCAPTAATAGTISCHLPTITASVASFVNRFSDCQTALSSVGCACQSTCRSSRRTEVTIESSGRRATNRRSSAAGRSASSDRRSGDSVFCVNRQRVVDDDDGRRRTRERHDARQRTSAPRQNRKWSPTEPNAQTSDCSGDGSSINRGLHACEIDRQKRAKRARSSLQKRKKNKK
jgi:hypothetical protein